jgi:hypothetical protein
MTLCQYFYIGIGILVNSVQRGIGQRGRSSYSIDGSSPTTYNNYSYQSTIEAYKSPTLPNGQHTLTVINLDNYTVLTLDSFLVFTLEPDATSSSSPGFLSALSTGSSALSAPNTTSSIPGTNSATTQRPNNSGQIALLIVGPMFGAFVICGIVYLSLKRWREKKELDSQITSPGKHFW